MTDSLPVLGGSLVLGRYRVVRELARGGMGMVYLGRIEGAAGFAKPVVIKRVLSHLDESSNSRAQFIREARLLSELHHPNIVGVIDFGEEDGSYLMVLEYVHGFHLGHWLRYAMATRGALEWEFAIYATIRVLSALHYAHTRTGSDGNINPIIHRDISPGNVLIDLDGNVRLLDFGIARNTGEHDELKTQEGVVKGKLPYIAPEMYQSKDASVASDVYAAGVMLYQLLAGKNPFSGKDMSAIVGRVLSYTPPPISSVREDIPPGLDEVIAKAIAKDPADRYESANAFAQALSEIQLRSEAEVFERIGTAIFKDFNGEMPELLRVPSLAELDAAWRASSRDPESEQPLQRSSTVPPTETDATAIIAAPQLESLTSSTRDEVSVHDQQTTQMDAAGLAAVQQLGRRSARAVTTPGVTPAEYFQSESHQMGSGAHQVPPANTTKTIILSMLGAGVLAGGIAAGVLIFGNKPPPQPEGQRFLLVERQKESPTSAPAPAPAPAPATTAPSADPKPAASTEPNESGPKPAPQPSSVAKPKTQSQSPEQALTSAFARRQGAVQSCFRSHAGELSGSPQISIRFQLAESGAVQAATLSPGSLTATSLGSCLLGVARSTTFPKMEKPIAFSIPITAQVVRK